VPCLLVPRLYYWAILGNIFFQSSLLLFAGTTFTLFFYGMTAASLAFVTWPTGPIPVVYDSASGFAAGARRLLEFCDLEEMFQWTPDRPRGQPCATAHDSLQLIVGDKVYSGFRALRMIVLLNPITYFGIAGAIAALGELPGPAVLGRRLIVATCLVLLMPPLAWILDTLFRRGVLGNTCLRIRFALRSHNLLN
nr:hypothetical protein [Acidobacteriota bacterium]